MTKNRVPVLWLCFPAVVAACATSADAAMTEFTNFAQWQSAAGSITTIGFTEYPTGTVLTTQYAGDGLVFQGGSDFVLNGFPLTYPQDGAGVRDNVTGVILVDLAQPHFAVSVHHPGRVTFRLFLDEQLVGESESLGGGGIDFFSGVISTIAFDSVMMFDDDGSVNIDNLYLDSVVPAPHSLAMFAFILLGTRRRLDRR